MREGLWPVFGSAVAHDLEGYRFSEAVATVRLLEVGQRDENKFQFAWEGWLTSQCRVVSEASGPVISLATKFKVSFGKRLRAYLGMPMRWVYC